LPVKTRKITERKEKKPSFSALGQYQAPNQRKDAQAIAKQCEPSEATATKAKDQVDQTHAQELITMHQTRTGMCKPSQSDASPAKPADPRVCASEAKATCGKSQDDFSHTPGKEQLNFTAGLRTLS